MAIISFGSFITSMSGKHGNIVHYCRRGTHCARMRVKQRNPDTPAQRLVRRSFAEAVKSWQALSEHERYKFNKKARFLNMSGYNLYISQCMRAVIQNAASISAVQPAMDHDGDLPFPVRFPSVSKPDIRACRATACAGPLKTYPG